MENSQNKAQEDRNNQKKWHEGSLKLKKLLKEVQKTLLFLIFKKSSWRIFGKKSGIQKKILLVDFETELQKNSQKKILRRISRNSQKELQEDYQKNQVIIQKKNLVEFQKNLFKEFEFQKELV